MADRHAHRLASAFYLGLDSFVGEVPILLFTLIGGVVADRRDRRHMMLMSQVVQMTVAFILAGAGLHRRDPGLA